MRQLVPSYREDLYALLDEYSYAEVLHAISQQAFQIGAVEISRLLEELAQKISD